MLDRHGPVKRRKRRRNRAMGTPLSARYANREARKRHRKSLTKDLNKALASRSAEEWEVILNEANVPAGRILSVPDVLASEQLRSRRFVEAFSQAESADRTLRITRPGFLLDRACEEPLPPPVLGADTRFWREKAGYEAAAIEAMLVRGMARAAEKIAGSE